MKTLALRDIAEIVGSPIRPANFPDEMFALYSIPAYSSGEPETLLGRAIGSNKTLVCGRCVLISKLNPRIPRVWFVDQPNEYRRICSTEFIPFKVRDISKTDPEWLSCVLLSPQFMEPLQNAVRPSPR